MDATLNFESGGRNFLVTRLNAFDQFHLSRKLAPLVVSLAPLVLRMSDDFKGKTLGEFLDTVKLTELTGFAGPFATALSGMEDADSEKLMTLTLTSVKVETAPGVWQPLWVTGAKMASVIELNDIAALIPVVAQVIKFNLGHFIPGFRTSHEEPQPVSSGADSRVRKIG